MINRFKNPIFISACLGLVYIILRNNGVTIGDVEFRTFVDLISYIVTGVGVDMSFDSQDVNNKVDK